MIKSRGLYNGAFLFIFVLGNCYMNQNRMAMRHPASFFKRTYMNNNHASCYAFTVKPLSPVSVLFCLTVIVFKPATMVPSGRTCPNTSLSKTKLSELPRGDASC